MADVFISYKSQEYEEASKVKKALEDSGISCWMAPDSIPGGSSYAAEILHAIRECRAFVLILSELAQESAHVAKELDLAINTGKTVLPFMLENCELKDDFYYYLSNVQRYPAYENKQRELERMIGEIKKHLLPADKEDKSQKPMTQPVKKFTAPQEKKAPKPKKEKVPKQKKEKAPKPQKAKAPASDIGKKVSAIIGGVLALAVVLTVVIVKVNTVTICGDKYHKNSSFRVQATSASVTEQDVASLQKLKKADFIDFSDCTFEGNALDMLLAHLDTYYSVTLENCGLTDENMQKADFGEGITALNLNRNQLTSLSFLKSAMPHVSELHISGNPITDFSALEEAELLTEIDLSKCEIEDLRPLANATRLTVVNADFCKLSSLDGLQNALELQELHAACNNLYSLNGITNATQLTYLNISGNKITTGELKIVAKSADKLQTLSIGNNPLHSLDALGVCTQVKDLHIGGAYVDSLNAVGKMKQLEQLFAAGCNITDIAPLKNCENLHTVMLSDNKITTIDALHFDNANQTYTLDLRNNQITSFDNLPAVTYGDLLLCGNPAVKYESLAGITCTRLFIDFDENTDYTAFDGSKVTGQLYLVDTPLDRQKNTEEAVGVYSVTFIGKDEVQDAVAGAWVN